MTRHVTALFDRHEEAAEAVRLLKEQKFTDREFTVVAKPDEASADDATGAHVSALNEANKRGGAWVGSALGAAVGGTVGLLSIALIPAIPLMMVGGAAVGGTAGNLFGDSGIGTEERARIERALQAGGVLIVVEQETDERAQLARELLQRARGRDIATAEARPS